jgi:hypothetical protein
MKKISTLLLACMLIGSGLQAQKPKLVSYSGTEYQKGKPYQKVWNHFGTNEIKNRSEKIDKKGEYIAVFRSDSMAMYSWNPETKKGSVLPMKDVKNLPDALQKRSGVSSKEEYLGEETVNNYKCKHYLNTSTHTYPDGRTETGCTETWTEETLGVDMQHTECNMREDMLTLMEFQIGEPAAQLFEIPKDVVFHNPFKQMDEMQKMMDELNNFKKMQSPKK